MTANPMTANPSGSRLSGLQMVAPALLAGAVPLVVLPGAFAPFHVGKWFAVLLLVPAGLAVCSLTGTLRWPLRNWFFVWMTVCVLATVLGVAPWMSVAGSPNRNAGLLAVFAGVGSFVLGASTGSEPTAQRVILRSAFLAGGAVGVMAIQERAGLDLFGVGDVQGLTRARSTWGSATFAGSHLVLVLPIAVAHLRSQDPLWRKLAMAATTSMSVGLVLTGTRGAWLGALAATVVLVPAWTRTRGVADQGTAAIDPKGRLESGSSSGQLTLWNLSARQIVLGALSVLVLFSAVALMAPNLGRSTGVGRIDQLRTAIPVIADRPLLGSGPDTQRVVLPSGIDESFERAHGSEDLHDRVHNVVFDTLVTTGVAGLAALLAVVFMIVRSVTPRLRNRLVPTAIAAGLVAYLVTLMFAFGDPAIDPIAWLLAGLLIVGVKDGGSDSSRGLRTSRFAAVGFLAIAAAGLVWAGGEILAEYRLDDAMDASTVGDRERAADLLESAAAVAPARFDLDQMAARVGVQSITAGSPLQNDELDAVGRTAKWASGRLDRAQRVAAEDPDVLMDRAELLTAWSRPAEAVDVYERIVHLYPYSFRAQLGLGLAEAQLKHPDRAQEAWSRAADLGPGDPRAMVNLGLLHESSGDPDSALRAFTEALERDPDAPGAAAGVARVSGPEGG
ncbi:MAG: O-antigen ligase family protein [Microthrixaceae bacterium]